LLHVKVMIEKRLNKTLLVTFILFIYDNHTNLDCVNVTYIESWASYFKNKGKHVYLSEYGFRTWKRKEHLALGMVSNETIKLD